MKRISFSTQLFVSIAILFLVFVVSLIFFQYTRERSYRENLMTMRLQDFNNEFYLHIRDMNIDKVNDSRDDMASIIADYVSVHGLDSLRVTLILDNGRVIYDNKERDVSRMSNHLNREEVRRALQKGSGSAVNRASETMADNFFYSATYYSANRFIIRSAMPYDAVLSNELRVDPIFIYFAVILSFLLYLIFFRYTHRMGSYIAQLRSFVQKADHNEQVEPEEISVFPDNDLGEISQHIVRIYKNLNKTREALYIEREKLIAHLQTSREGLGIFSKERKSILANSLFTQYANLISDFPLAHNAQALELPAFAPILKFLEDAEKGEATERKINFQIEKDGRIFDVECVCFQDFTFEVSICDVTQQEGKARLKRQLTQNIAHELKTPITSIQGYLETIINSELPAEMQEQFLNRCFAQSNRLVNLLRDISVLTRMDEATQMMDKENVDISQMFQNIQRETALQLDAKKMRVNNLLPPSLVINGNASLIYSIFRNLTDNAIAYAGEGTTITIRCFRQDDNFMYFSFADNGVGVGNEHLTRIFERFYRVDKGRSRKLGGTGLGLAIVKNAVAFHGGNISAKNVQTGGLEFVFSLHK